MKKILLLLVFGFGGEVWSGVVVNLPPPELKGGAGVNQVISSRRSVRSYQETLLSLQDISQLCWSAQGITDLKSGYRASPSAGPLYPLSLYLVVKEKGVSGLSPGIYLYLPKEHSLKQIRAQDLSVDLVKAALNQDWMRKASAIFVFTGNPDKMSFRYKERTWQYIYLEAGMASENLMLSAVARGLSSCPVGAFFDEKVAEVVGISSKEKPLLLVPVGKKE